MLTLQKSVFTLAAVLCLVCQRCQPILAVISDGFFISNTTHILIVNLTEEPKPVYSTENGRIIGLAVDVRERFLFWSDVSLRHRAIYRGHITSTGTMVDVVIIIHKDITEVNGLSVDWLSRHLYWTDSRKHTIEMAGYDGNNRRVLLDTLLYIPRSIHVDSQHGWLFWNDQGYHQIERSYLDGSNREVIVNNDVKWPNQMTVYENQLYWVDAWNNTLMRCELTGDSVTEVSWLGNVTGDSSVFGLTIYDDVALVSVWYTGMLVKVDLQTGDTSESRQGLGYDALFSMTRLTNTSQLMGNNLCGPNGFGGCDKICLPVGLTKYRCSCPSYGGLVLDSDQKRCIKPDNLVVYALADLGVVGFFDPDNIHSMDRYLVGRSLRPVAVAYDPTDQMVYWSDVQRHTIFTAGLNGGNVEQFLGHDHFLGVVDGLAIDSLHRKLYFTNTGMVKVEGTSFSWHKVEVADLDNGAIRTLTEAYKPRGLWVDATKGDVYYTDWGDSARVVRMDLDGSHKNVLSVHFKNPNGITSIGNTLYVIDSNYKTAESGTGENSDHHQASLYSADRTGGDWKKQEASSLNLKVPFSVTSGGNRLYISDWGQNAIIEVNMEAETQRVKTILPGVNSPMGLYFSPRTSSTGGGDFCAQSTCPDMCLVNSKENSSVCVCDSYDVMIAESSATCQLPSSFMIVADMNDIKLIGLDTSDTSTYTKIQGSSYFSNFVSVVYDADRKNIYFSDVNRRIIYKATLDGSNSEVLYRGNHVIDGLAIGISGRRLYFTDYLTGQIASIDLDKDDPEKSAEIIASSLNKPRGIVTSEDGIYWTEWGSPASVFYLDLHGNTTVQTLWTHNSSIPNAVYVDEENGYIYIGDASKGVVIQCTISDWKCSELWYLNANEIYDIHKQGDILLYSDWKSGSIVQVHLSTGVTRTLAGGLMRPSQMTFHLEREPTCPSEHGCSDICIAWLNGVHTCVCEPHKMLDLDGKTCSLPNTHRDQWMEVPSLHCQSCPVSSTCARLVNTTMKSCVCHPGYEGTTQNKCSECTIGTYKDWLGNDRCTGCPSFGQAKSPRSTQCSCDKGLVWDPVRHSCSGSKAGKCPEVFSEAIDDCRSSCEEEHECSGAQKCCPHPQCQASQCMDPWDLSQVQCVYLGKVYTTGQRFEPNSCTKCRCTKDKNNGNSEFGGAMCDIETCPKHTCSLQTHRKQQCCPVCDDSPPSGNGLEFVNCPASMLNDKDVGVLDVALPADKSYVLHNLTLTTKDLLNLNRQVFIRKQPDVLFFPWAESAWLINVTASSRRPDGSTDTATCVYKIQVKDTTAPHIQCPDPRKIYTNTSESNVFWAMVKVSDNVGVAKGFPKASHENGMLFTVGSHTVTYTAEDLAENVNKCSFPIKIINTGSSCRPEPIRHGSWQCLTQPSSLGGGVACTVRCDRDSARGPGFDTLETYRCNLTAWSPPLPSPLLACVRIGPRQVKVTLEMLDLRCEDSPFLMPTLHGVVHAFLSEQPKNMKNITLIIKKKSCIRPTRISREKKSANSMNLKLLFTLDVSAENDYNTSRDRFQQLIESLSNAMNSGQLKLWPAMRARPDVVFFSHQCTAGQLIYQQQCMYCTAGYYHNSTRDSCDMCPEDTYNDEDGQVNCKECPPGLSASPEATSAKQCFKLTEHEKGQTDADTNDSVNVGLISGASIGAVIATLVICAVIIGILRQRQARKTPVPLPSSRDPTLHYENRAYEAIGIYARDQSSPQDLY